MPPADAPLTVAPSGSVQGTSDGKHRDLYALGFQTDVGQVQINGYIGTLLMGTHEVHAQATAAAGKIIQRRLAADDGLPTGVQWVQNENLYEGVFPVNDWLLLAAQCHLRGHTRIAREILARGLAREDPAAERLTPLGDGSLRDALAASAWNHWMESQTQPDTDRRAVLTHLEKLAAEFPALNGAFQRDYLDSLRLALVPGPERAADDPERFVDGLVEHYANPATGVADTDDENYAELLRRGFGAVPALLAHLDDRRLTRSVSSARGAYNRPRCVGEIAGDLVSALAGTRAQGEQLAGPPSPGQPLDKEKVVRWWAGASALGEEMYMTTQAFPPDEISLQILSDRYPGRLAEVYARTLAEPPGNDSTFVAEAICDCAKLPHEERCRLLRTGVDSPRLDRCIEALTVLGRFDRSAGDAALIVCLDRWPKEASDPYRAYQPETRVGQLLINTDSAGVWQAYERALFRASASLRMEMLSRMCDYRGDGSTGVRQLALLDLFLDDPEVRVVRPEDEKPGGVFEGQTFSVEERRLRVGDYVAGLIDRVIQAKPPAGTVHDERWHTRHRAAASEAIDQRAREELQTPMPQL